MVKAYCQLVILSRKDIETVDRVTLLTKMAEVVRLGKGVVADLSEFWQIYREKIDDGWGGACTIPSTEYVKQVVEEWEDLYKVIKKKMFEWQDPLRDYFADDYYHKLFSEKWDKKDGR